MIKARIEAENPNANLGSYSSRLKAFSWEDEEKNFTWNSTGKVNIVQESIDRWAVSDRADRSALIFEQIDRTEIFSFRKMKDDSCRWANFLSELGFGRGDRLFIFLSPCPEVYLAMLACARLGVIFTPLYATLGYDELEDRISNAEPIGILTQPDLAERLPIDSMDMVQHLIFTEGPLPGLFEREILAADRLREMPDHREPEWLDRDAPLYLIFTSGSTGPPKGVLHAHGDMSSHFTSARYVLDIDEDSVLWTDGDPAWITGAVYGAFAPWLCGATSVVQGAPFSASTWYRTLERHGVTVWYTTPMTIRRLIEAGRDLPTRYDFSRLGHIATVGETLDPEHFYWSRENLRHSPHDTWWMTESGCICLANFPSMDIKPGSMGKPVPGIHAAIIDENGEALPMLTMGQLAIQTPWPSLMRGIWNDENRFREYFTANGWFLTGDMALMDEEGYFYHQGRMDDLIKVGDKMIGPYEIEHTLIQHPSVLEAAVISKGSRPSSPSLKAFVTIQRGYTASNRLNQEIKAFVKANLSPDIPLREVEFCDRLPKTSAGKLLRRVLRAQELGLPSGDTSNML